MIKIDITHSNFQGHRWAEIRVDPDWTVEKLKEKVYMLAGTSASTMSLCCKVPGKGDVSLADDATTLDAYGVTDMSEVHVTDTDPNSISSANAFTDTSRVEKFQISEEAYQKKSGNARDFLNRLRENRPKAVEKEGGEGKKERPKTPENAAQVYPIGSRCEVQPGGRRGEVAYVGPVEGGSGTFIGVKLDEPLGVNDGRNKAGKRYFDAPDKYGIFARPEKVTVGDFPEKDPFASSDEEEDNGDEF
uniref:CAP-Gly domain-containing protein n=1 Tax=Chromera velia CCMP2878 TaxID=1169474 RepID=A0A0G4HP01_9ALVE|mmetsp:Transcript_54967/g.107510  ORF Transcript_54967/g.107510 Transcript_54967/m.107510 type:complete len:246 (-) Transcript_54967:265-1002(-)|eukprot:Cvel_29762.t1-p1 / transcript=Cvel_29762.t1 / gene=Cvel_29762 / organism=Chromera_velia_CCMP2878 / gene_product=Tubulin-folding cofactor B, putative / transcript_product=Tubulin-folding cofactor B, putative / location=Cvel_scaffold4133:2741-5736(-) / protein_length=245 / sequence_SO=supercontig / SO=protein_coding / is_pseudo=false